MARVVLDASVVLGAVDATDTTHARCEAALRGRAEDELLLPASAYAEVLVRPLAHGKGDALDKFLERLGIGVVPIDRPTARRAAELRGTRRAPRLPDALVLAAGDVLDADEVLTADRAWRRLSERVVVV